ncbi:hypothetical protein JW898_02210 [Candidatus Woesearchaeota archaeon]|nr:hypothetical protein [Candidatus Woesearchaeota archaeon]
MALSAPVFSDVSTGDVFQLWSNKLFGGMTGNPFTNWYEVADWEVKVCFDWGGERDPNQVFGDTLQGDIYHDTVIAIQAGADNPLPEEFANHVGERLYEVSWFVQPTQTDEDMNFEVFLVDALGGKKVIGSGNSNYVNGFRDYFVEYSSANYTKASIHYWNLRDDEWREVPVVG